MQNSNEITKKRTFESVSGHQEDQNSGNKKRKPENPKKMSFQSFKLKKNIKQQQSEAIKTNNEGMNVDVLVVKGCKDSGEGSNGPTGSGSSQAQNQNTQFPTQTDNMHLTRKLANRAKPFNPLQEIEASRLKKVKEVKQKQIEVKKLQNVLVYNEGSNIPEDWSIKTNLNLTLNFIKNQSSNKIIEKIEKNIVRHSEYYVFNSSQTENLSMNEGKFYQRNKQVINWYKSLNDVYTKLQSDNQTCFYIRTNNFICVFRKQNQNESICQVIPSTGLNQTILDQQEILGLEFNTDKILVDEENTNESGNNQAPQSKTEDDDPLDLDEIMAGLKEPINMESHNEVMNESYFNIRMKDHYKLLTFRNKNVQSIFNLIGNFIGNKFAVADRNQGLQFAQIIAPYKFINCTYKECQVIYKGLDFESNSKQSTTQRYTIKTNGIYMKDQIKNILQEVWTQTQNLEQTDQGVIVSLMTENQSKLLNLKQTLTKIKCEQANKL